MSTVFPFLPKFAFIIIIYPISPLRYFRSLCPSPARYEKRPTGFLFFARAVLFVLFAIYRVISVTIRYLPDNTSSFLPRYFFPLTETIFSGRIISATEFAGISI